MDFLKNYPRVIGMFILLLFIPPLGWIFTYRFSPYDKKTSWAIAIVCTFFFVYSVFISPQHEFVDVGNLTRESFCTRYNEQVAKLAPNLNLTVDENNLKIDGNNFSYKITDKIKIAAKVSKNNFVREVVVTAAPKTTDESFQALNCYGLVIATLNPELNQDKRGEVLRELKLLETNINENINTSTESGRITYLIKTDGGNVTFTAKIAD